MGVVDTEWLKFEIKSVVLDLCKKNRCFLGDLEVDGIICINPCQSLEDQLVVKIHTLISDVQKNKPVTGDSKSIEKALLNQEESLNEKILPSQVGHMNNGFGIAAKENVKESKNGTRCWSVGEDLYLVEGGDEFSDEIENSETDESIAKRRKLFINEEDIGTELKEEETITNIEIKNEKPRFAAPISIRPLHVITSVNDRMVHDRAENMRVPRIQLTSSSHSHSATHTGLKELKVQEEKNFTCVKCDKVCFSLAEIQYHVESEHLDLDQAAMPLCRFCGKSYNRKDVLQYHVANHFMHNPFRCGVCMKTFCDKGTLYKHVKNQHKVLKVNYCSTCLFGFTDEKSFAEHKEVNCVASATQVHCPWCDHTDINVLSVATHVISAHWQTFNSPLKSEANPPSLRLVCQ